MQFPLTDQQLRALEHGNVTALIRHAESDANAKGIIGSHFNARGGRYGLTELGKMQAREAARKFRPLIALYPHKPVVGIASPFRRTVQTLEVFFDELELNTEIKTDIRFGERDFGQFEGTSVNNYQRVWDRDSAGLDVSEWGVEALTSVFARTQPALQGIRTLYPNHFTIVSVHGDIASNTIAADQGEPLTRHREVGALRNAEMYIVRVA